ncbi:MAG TPA: hypothetical protein VJS45_18775, partial [Acidimicrobiia bacterium]|nr:hypothetical protein [Acidimicrobiia bacterium]
VIDTTPAGRPRRTRPARVPAAAASANGGELVTAPAGGLAAALNTGGGLTLPPRPVSRTDGRR